MKTFAGDMHTESGENRFTRFFTLLSYFLLLGVLAIVAAIAVSSMSSVAKRLEEDPGRLASFTAHRAARAGVSAAVNHIQCHSYLEGGALPMSSLAGGGRFSVVWEKPNLTDSTVRMTSFGFCQEGRKSLAQTSVDTVARIEFFNPQQKPKMERYYSLGLGRGR